MQMQNTVEKIYAYDIYGVSELHLLIFPNRLRVSVFPDRIRAETDNQCLFLSYTDFQET